MKSNAELKTWMLNRSMRCFLFGLLGLIPLIGLPFAFAALWLSGRVRVLEKNYWNAAKPYRIWGLVCAVLGTFFWAGIAVIVITPH
jgi:hypothetical protein